MGQLQHTTRKHHIQEGQEVSPFPAGDHKTARNRQDSMTKTKHKYKKKIRKRSTALERLVRKLLEVLNMITVPTSPKWINRHRCLVLIEDPQLIREPSDTCELSYNKEIKQM